MNDASGLEASASGGALQDHEDGASSETSYMNSKNLAPADSSALPLPGGISGAFSLRLTMGASGLFQRIREAGWMHRVSEQCCCIRIIDPWCFYTGCCTGCCTAVAPLLHRCCTGWTGTDNRFCQLRDNCLKSLDAFIPFPTHSHSPH